MPHVSEFHATGDHDRHDALLVAALAAGDLSGSDRDHALDLTRSCAMCADLHDDLVAIGRATASAPPPIATRPRDFQLTPADAARLRPGGLRRLIPTFRAVGGFASRPLGVGLAALGLVGLLVGNVPALGGNAGAPEPMAARGSGDSLSAENAGGAQPAASSAADSGAPAYVQAAPAPSAAASSGAGFGTELGAGASPSAVPGVTQDTTVRGAPGSSPTLGSGAHDGNGGGKSAASPSTEQPPAALTSTTDTAPLRPLNIVFALAVIVGLGILVAARFRSRSTV